MENYFSKNLIFLREHSGETQIELATALDITRSTYANYEGGENLPKLDVIGKLLGHFGVTFEELVSTDLSNVQVNENPDKKNRTKNVQGNVQGNVQVNYKKDDFLQKGPHHGDADAVRKDFEANMDLIQAKYTDLLEKYNRVLEGKLIEHEFRYKIEDISASVKALQELVINENLLEFPLPSQKEAFFHKKKQDQFVKSGILSGDST